MAKAKAKSKTTVNASAIETGTAIAKYLSAQDDTCKNMVENICQHLTEKYPSGHVETDGVSDVETIVTTIADARGWPQQNGKDTRSRTSRKSEVRAVILAFWELPLASEIWREKATSYEWHDAVRIARRLPKVNNNCERAVNAVLQDKRDKTQKQTDPRTTVKNFLDKFQRLQTRNKDLIAFRKSVMLAAKKNNLL